MADTPISGLTAVGTGNLAGGDEFPINDVSIPGTRKATITNLRNFLQENFGLPRVSRLNSQHSISSTTGTAVAGLTQTLEAGTYTFTYALMVRSATATVGPMLGINFTGTGAPRMHFRFADATTVITAEVHAMSNQGNKGFGFISGMASNTETTTAPDMGTTIGVAATATDILCFIEGILIVTVAGDLELWHSSETATATSVEVGSSLVVIRTA